MSEFNLEPELSLNAGVSVTTSQFVVDLSKLVNVFEDVMFMFFFEFSTLTGLFTFTTRFIVGPYIKRIETLRCLFLLNVSSF